MPKQSLVILSVMLMVFSLTLAAGGASYMFYISPDVHDKYIEAALFWAGALIGLFGLAGSLAALVGIMSAIFLKIAEAKNTGATQEFSEEVNTEQETL